LIVARYYSILAEDIEDVYLAEAALERFRASGEKAVSLEAVMKEYGLEY
jgi:RHH-type rel operon transcriptional repressor/antitoxin RelB